MMRRLWILFVLLLSLHVGASSFEIHLTEGESRVLSIPKLVRVAIADPSIADVAVVGSGDVILNGIKSGRTTLQIWETGQRLEVSVLVTPQRSDQEAEIRVAIGRDSVKVSVVDGTVILQGEVSSAWERTRAEAIASAFGRRVINLLSTPEDPADPLVEKVARTLGEESLKIRMVGESIVLEGPLPSLDRKLRALELTRALGVEVIDLISLPADRQKFVDSTQFLHALQIPGLVVRKFGEVHILEGQLPDDEAHRRVQTLLPYFTGTMINLTKRAPGSSGPMTLSDQVIKALGSTTLKVLQVGSTLILEGEASWEERQRALAVAEALAPQVVDLIDLPRDPAPGLMAQLRQTLGIPGVEASLVGGRVILEGQVRDEKEKRRAEEIARALVGPTVNLLTISSTPEPIRLPSEVMEQLSKWALQVQDVQGVLILSGVVSTKQERDQAMRLVSSFASVVDLIEVAQRDHLAELRALLPGVSVVLLNSEEVLLEGEVASAREVQRADSLARALFPKVHNLLEVTPIPQADLVQEVRSALGGLPIGVSQVHGTLILEGVVSTRQEKEWAQSIASLFGRPVLNLLKIGTDLDPLQVLQQDLPPGVQARWVQGTLVLEGSVSSQNQLQQAVALAQLYGPVLNHLVLAPEKILVEVYLLELERSSMDRFGVSWEGQAPGVFSILQLSPGGISPALSGQALLEALVKDGKGQVLAAPTLMAMDGREAQFMVGGEIPILVPGEQGIATEWKEYGISLSVRPQRLASGISLAVRTEVSTLDAANGLRIAGELIPALRTRWLETELILEDGEPLLIGGLLSSEEALHTQGIPLLKDLPILGNLFRSESFRRQETELVIWIRPQILGKGE